MLGSIVLAAVVGALTYKSGYNNGFVQALKGRDKKKIKDEKSDNYIDVTEVSSK